MQRTNSAITGSILILATAGTAGAQALDLSWNSIDGGGGVSTAGTLELIGTIGQPDAGTLSGGGLQCLGGFFGVPGGPPPCYANCDGSTGAPVLNVNDFICFQGRFAAGDPYANCDGSTGTPALNVNDFVCFQSAFAAGCP